MLDGGFRRRPARPAATGPTRSTSGSARAATRSHDFSFDDGDRIHLSSAVQVAGAWVEGESGFVDLGGGDLVELKGVGAAELAEIAASFGLL